MARGYAARAFCAWAVTCAGSAGAATIVVDATTNGNTNSACELFDAAYAAENHVAKDGCPAGSASDPYNRIVFARALAGQTITYPASDLTISSGNLVIDGEGRKIVLQASGGFSDVVVGGGNVTVQGIDLRADQGAGLVAYGGTVTLNDSSIASRIGVNVFGNPSTTTINNSTISATDTNPASALGVRSGAGNVLHINNSTIVTTLGTGVDCTSSSGATTIYSSIVVGPTAVNCAAAQSGGTLTAISFASAGLAAFGDNGGPTRTYALVSGPAINGGSCASAPLPGHDQRYYVNNATTQRQVGAACDAGAYESGAAASTDPIFADGFDGH